MIIFKPKQQNNNAGTIKSYMDNLPAIASQKVADQLNSKFGEKHCPEHPTIDSIILVDMIEGGPVFEVGDYCCENFKHTLDLLAANRNPF